MMDLDIFQCPACKKSSLREAANFVQCDSCSARYPVFDRSINFIEEFRGLSETQKAQKKFYEADPTAYPQVNMNDFIKDVIDGSRLTTKIYISHKQFDTYRQIKKLNIRASNKVLDVGCFDGRNCFLIEKLAGAHCYGVDISLSAVRRAQSHARNSALQKSDFHVALAEKLPFVDRCFDRVISLDVLEHIEDKESFLREIDRVLKPKGTALIYAISKHDRHSLHWTLRKISKGTLGRDEGGGHVYENFADPVETRALCDRLHIQTVHIEPFHGFFSLFLDEYLSRRIGYKIKYFFRLARFLDTPLSIRKIGNGFYLRIIK